MAGAVHIPFYSTGLRSDKLAEALAEVAPVSVRYGATGYFVHRSQDDRHKFLLAVFFESKLEWERYWTSREFTDFRIVYNGYWQVPVLYVWNDVVVEGTIESEEDANEQWYEGGTIPDETNLDLSA